MPIWQKVGLAAGLTVPPILAGLFTNIGSLLLISGVTTVGFALNDS